MSVRTAEGGKEKRTSSSGLSGSGTNAIIANCFS